MELAVANVHHLGIRARRIILERFRAAAKGDAFDVTIEKACSCIKESEGIRSRLDDGVLPHDSLEAPEYDGTANQIRSAGEIDLGRASAVNGSCGPRCLCGRKIHRGLNRGS